ncbi:HAD-like domain protein [Raphanus sativus]|nr:HAD-like domain protein [Raphanus sativus]
MEQNANQFQYNKRDTLWSVDFPTRGSTTTPTPTPTPLSTESSIHPAIRFTNPNVCFFLRSLSSPIVVAPHSINPIGLHNDTRHNGLTLRGCFDSSSHHKKADKKAPALNRFIADRYLSNHSVSELPCLRVLQADIRVHEFFKTSYFKKGIYPLPGAHNTLHKLSRYCELSVVTSRQNAIKDHTLEWLDMHFPGLFKQIHFGNHFALHGDSKPKSEICRSFGAEVLIDDNPRYAEECANIGMKVLLFDYENSYPWSKTESVDRHPLVTRVHNWEEVEQHILSLVVSKC